MPHNQERPKQLADYHSHQSQENLSQKHDSDLCSDQRLPASFPYSDPIRAEESYLVLLLL